MPGWPRLHIRTHDEAVIDLPAAQVWNVLAEQFTTSMPAAAESIESIEPVSGPLMVGATTWANGRSPIVGPVRVKLTIVEWAPPRRFAIRSGGGSVETFELIPEAEQRTRLVDRSETSCRLRYALMFPVLRRRLVRAQAASLRRFVALCLGSVAEQASSGG